MHLIQQKLLRLADTYNIGAMPFREIGKMISEEHPQSIKYHLEQLEKKNLIEWDRNNNSITKVGSGAVSNSDLLTIPVLGSANCGDPTIFATEHIEGHIKVSRGLLRNRINAFAIKAVGSSMNNANIGGKGIDDGDYVIVDPTDVDIKDNDYVLSIIDDTANIKKIKFDRDHDQIILCSESTYSYPPIYIHCNEASKYLVNGRIVQVMKNSKI
jgi:SOS-response transcriptional repressor LexA